MEGSPSILYKQIVQWSTVIHKCNTWSVCSPQVQVSWSGGTQCTQLCQTTQTDPSLLALQTVLQCIILNDDWPFATTIIVHYQKHAGHCWMSDMYWYQLTFVCTSRDAPASTSSFTVVTWPLWEAINRAVAPSCRCIVTCQHTMYAQSGSQCFPSLCLWSSADTITSWTVEVLTLVWRLRSALAIVRVWTTSSWPLWQATWRAVHLSCTNK